MVSLVVFGLASGDFAIPIVGEAHAAVLALHLFDVGAGPFAGLAVVFDGGVFSGETEGVPAHGVEDVEAAHPLIAGEGVTDGVVTDVPDVERSGGVGEHFEDVELGLGGVLLGGEEFGVFGPAGAPLGFNFLMAVDLFGHDGLVDEGAEGVDVALVVAFVIDGRFQDEGLVAEGAGVEDSSKPLYSNIAFADVGVAIEVGAEFSFGVIGVEDGDVFEAQSLFGFVDEGF